MGEGDHPETYLLKAVFCQSTPSWLKVRGWWVVAHEIILSSPGTGGRGTLYFHSHFPFPSPIPIPIPIPILNPSPVKYKVVGITVGNLEPRSNL